MGLNLKKNISQALLLLVINAMVVFVSSPAFALAPEFERNGECYMLIGEGLLSLRGVYRFNNPEVPKYFTPPKYLFRPNTSFGFSVDLNRKIYTFSEVVGSHYIMIPGNIKRQVIDTVSAANADFGYHAYIHYDHRTWGAGTNIYRTGPAGRQIIEARVPRNIGHHLYSNGPGTAISTPAGNPLPNITGNTSLGVYPGKQWYAIPNGAWYSTWRHASSTRTSYRVYGDKEEGLPHNWTLYTWVPNDLSLDAPVYTSTRGSVVATSYDKRVTRKIFAGCLDGCGGASGSGSSVADPFYNDIAFQPPIGGSISRTYFYSRPQTQPGYWITLNNSPYNPTTANPLIGLPSDLSTKWVGISLRNANTDYVYNLGTQVIRNWYHSLTNQNSSGINISAVTVSNQWNQKGGIIYAYDKTSKIVYKFVRDEQSGSPLALDRFEAINFAPIISSIGADSNSEIDDIKSDGFGSLYFALSAPSKNVAVYNPPDHFALNDAINVKVDTPSASDASQTAFLIYRQDYGKYVYERNIYDGNIREIGHKTYASRYYNLPVRMLKAGVAELASLTYPNNSVSALLASWSADIGSDKNFTASDFSAGSYGMYSSYDFGDPGHAKLAVINIPTPPKVLSLNGKKSYMDIIGPYTSYPSPGLFSTNQGNGLIKPEPANLQPATTYYYMLENYPLYPVSQDPNAQPDWDGDGIKGGFVTSMVDPNPAHGRIHYEWKTWLVQDSYGNVMDPAKLISTVNHNFTYFYSPVPGKYIITCRAWYDWYDYDSLPFGSTIADLPSVYHHNEKAIPASTSPSGTSGLTQLNSIMTNEFAFMTASGTPDTYRRNILGNDAENQKYYYVKAISVAGNTPPTASSTDIARLQRCDVGGGNNPNNPAHWFPQGTDVAPPLGYHGLRAGKQYDWRMDVASQANIFFDISTSNNTNPSSNNFNIVAKKLLDPNDPIYANSDPDYVFKNNVGETKWLDSDVRVDAHLDYSVPDASGNKIKVSLPLLTKSHFTSADQPIVCRTSGQLPPTDPYNDAEIVITMKRMFQYDKWIHINTGSGWIWSPGGIGVNTLELEARARVMIIDTTPPELVYKETTPYNLFGIAGMPLTSGTGPGGTLVNPSSIKFTVKDNNPWESVQGVVGITDQTTWNNNFSYNASLKTKAAPTAQYNYKPVFAKNLNRWINLSFESSTNNVTGKINVATASLDFSKSGPYSYTSQASALTSNIVGDFANASVTETIGDDERHISKVQYSMDLKHITLGSDSAGNPVNIIPKSYANNTPGYRNSDGTINPYRFYVNLCDSSGNSVPVPLQLNLALHVKDKTPPNPYGIITEFKGNTTTYFPVRLKYANDHGVSNADAISGPTYTMGNLASYTYNNEYVDDLVTNWFPDKTQSGYVNGNVGYFQALMSMGDDIVTNFTSTSDGLLLKAQIDNALPPKYMEDNVEFEITTKVTDNAGAATSTLTFKYLDINGTPLPRLITSAWRNSAITSDTIGQVATGSTRCIFRGRSGDFPMAIPVKIEAQDNALNWDSYKDNGVVGDAFVGWSASQINYGSPAPNKRIFKTTIPVYGSKLIIRTLDEGIRNK